MRNQELRQQISELRGMRTWQELRDFLVNRLEELVEPEEPEEVISEEVAALIETMTKSEKVVAEYFEAIENLTEENALKALGTKKDTGMSKADFLVLCGELLVEQIGKE